MIFYIRRTSTGELYTGWEKHRPLFSNVTGMPFATILDAGDELARIAKHVHGLEIIRQGGGKEPLHPDELDFNETA
jgi:hypothetical protein